ncbi:UDP-glucose--hexose-1-phosphate uridylyltransferase [Priestia filamentosa]|uniref:UDP-glucose--hexose-1-phosphate uridylyltransferase n=1 Tax=Priestia filamentosa TaxID=1402861 RepID=UPI00031E7CA2|nr:UDP-glucose--hexose-1-phosphate uridylyltransferase [Priestia filamentosa]
MNIFSVIQSLVEKTFAVNLIESEDRIYARNRLLSLLGFEGFPEHMEETEEGEIPDLVEKLVSYAVEKNIISDLLDQKEMLSSDIMNVFLPRPSEVNRTFYELYEKDPAHATNYFYTLSQNSNYIQTKRIAKNIAYKVNTDYGELDITINLSKPEKDPKQIAAEKQKKQTEYPYPKCLLCIENEGYEGRIGHPARSNHRMIRMNLTNEEWLLQYSPYVYYNEHCIVLSSEHRDMKISKSTFTRLLEFVEKFPHYFIGSNADLPIVGGSILTHDHYQGGNYEFSMAKANENHVFTLKEFPNVHGAIVNWPMSVIRLRSQNREELVRASFLVLETWKNYSDPRVSIEAYTGDTPHNTVTPIARMRDGQFEIDLVLRNNRTTEDYPLGIFHPHEDVHHIKKENIGLIEVMGLAVLPARLEKELKEVAQFLLGEQNEIATYHLHWAEEIKEKYGDQLLKENITEVLQKEVGMKFLRVLEDAGVFKQDSEGREAFRNFIGLLEEKTS